MLQMLASGSDQEKNKSIAEKFCREAAAGGADIALFPEMFNIGYLGFIENDDETVEKWKDQAVYTDGEWVGHFRKLAKELDMAIGCTYLERKKDGSDPGNSISLIDRHGDILFTYSKMHTCDFACFEASCTPGDNFYVAELDTKKGMVKTGAMICYDREFPESARMLMLKGAEIVLTPNACPLDFIRHNQFQTRAFENTMAMFMTNYPEEGYEGKSVAYNGDGNLIALADREEQILYGNVDILHLRDLRTKSIWGNSFRRPRRYDLLTDMEVSPEFARVNGFGQAFDRSQR